MTTPSGTPTSILPGSSAHERPFRIRTLGAILSYLHDQADTSRIGPTVSDWCRREELALPPETEVAQAKLAIQTELFKRVGLLEA